MKFKDIKLKKQNNKKSITPLVLGAAGLAVGAGIAAAVKLNKNKKARKQFKSLMNDVKDQALNYAQSLRKEQKTKPQVKKVVKVTNKIISKSKTSKSLKLKKKS